MEIKDNHRPGTRRVRAVVAGVAAVGLGIGGWALLADDMTNRFGPDSVCGEMVSAAALNGALGSGKVSAASYEGSASRGTAMCRATVNGGIFGDDRSVSVYATESKDVFHFPVDPGARPFTASANGGAVGAVHGSSAWALLPADCPDGLRVEVRADGPTPDALGLARLAVSTANRVADQRGCGRAPLPAPHELAPAGGERELDTDAACGLPGVTVGRSPGKRYKEVVSAGSDPLWSCAITPEGRDENTSVLVIATESRLRPPAAERDTSPAFGRARWVGSLPRDEIVVTCHGRPTYFRIGTVRQLGRLFPTGDEAWKQFLTAGGEAIGCEPIL
ncbi:hypothetical protein AB0E96_04760 [Kitasatospora sp. NPDC036755]|uniref:hypothetical protein n=1 Tax=Kitasatospora sp. NPDC036755 TaxID=3154600 RepID=UPI0034060B35